MIWNKPKTIFFLASPNEEQLTYIDISKVKYITYEKQKLEINMGAGSSLITKIDKQDFDELIKFWKDSKK